MPKQETGNYSDERGRKVGPDDPARMIWYGLCTYWTDDWNHVAGNGVPHCPHCGSPGFIATARDWLEGALKFEAEGREGQGEPGPKPGYVEFLSSFREVCSGRRGPNTLDSYELWVKVREFKIDDD